MKRQDEFTSCIEIVYPGTLQGPLEGREDGVPLAYLEMMASRDGTGRLVFPVGAVWMASPDLQVKLAFWVSQVPPVELGKMVSLEVQVKLVLQGSPGSLEDEGPRVRLDSPDSGGRRAAEDSRAKQEQPGAQVGTIQYNTLVFISQNKQLSGYKRNYSDNALGITVHKGQKNGGKTPAKY